MIITSSELRLNTKIEMHRDDVLGTGNLSLISIVINNPLSLPVVFTKGLFKVIITNNISR